jgi:hypothetical protein
MVLDGRGSADPVVSLSHCLAIGPISSGTLDERMQWLNKTVPNHLDWGWVRESTEQFLATVRAAPGERLVWIAPQSACEQCGLQWFFEQFDSAASKPMIIADQPLSRGGWVNGPPLGLGELPKDLITELLDRAPRRAWPAERSTPNLWRRLRAEDSLLRIVDDGRLRSVEPDFFDPLLIEHTPDESTKWSRVVGRTMVEAAERGHNIGDAYLVWRVRELVKQGRIACEGELPGREHDEHRRPNAMLRRPG